MPDLRELIREILVEVLDSMPERQRADVRHEHITLGCSADLNDFVKSVVERAQDSTFADAVRDGRHVFDLDRSSLQVERRPPIAPIVSSMPTEVATLTKALITERDLAQFTPRRGRLQIGSKSRLTPLAADELRRRGVTIERIPT